MNFPQIVAASLHPHLRTPHPLQLTTIHALSPGEHAGLQYLYHIPITNTPICCATIIFKDNHISITTLRMIERNPKQPKPGHQLILLYYEDPQLLQQIDQITNIAHDIYHELQQ